MSKKITRLRILGAGALIALSLAATVAARRAAHPGQDPPASPQEQKKDSSKKEDKADRADKADKAEKGPALVKVNVTVKADGATLPDALVLVKPSGGFERISSTNSAGVAHFSQVPRGKTTVQVTAPGFKPHTREAELSGSEVNLEIVLEKQ